MTNQTCPTCGNQAEVVTSSEGTGCFKPRIELKDRIVKYLKGLKAQKSTHKGMLKLTDRFRVTKEKNDFMSNLDTEIKEVESILTELGGEE